MQKLLLKKQYNISNSIASEIVEAFLKTVIKMAEGDGVVLQNFGKFRIQNKKISKKVYNFTTKNTQTMEIEKSVMQFTPSKNLKSRIF